MTSESKKIFITTADRIKRELSIIEMIYKAQYQIHDPKEPYPYILDKNGRSGIDGRYLVQISVLSDVPLLSLQEYKSEFTMRFESTTNLSLLTNQLLSIHERATEVKNYYAKYLTKGNKIVDQFLAKNKSLSGLKYFEEQREFLDYHRAVVTISEYRLMEIYIGGDWLSSPLPHRRDEYKYNYALLNNYELFNYCHYLIDFIDQFGLQRSLPAVQNTSAFSNKLDSLHAEDVAAHFRKELVDKKYLSEETLRQFLLAAFQKQKPPKHKFQLLKMPPKGKIIKVFNDYYKKAGKTHGQKKVYASLLADYFEGFSLSNVMANFSR